MNRNSSGSRREYSVKAMSDSRIAIITGATGAIGFAIAWGLAQSPECHVHLVARNAQKVHQAVERLQADTGNRHIEGHVVDLSNGAAIYALAAAWEGPVHVLINNAATCPRRRQESKEGVEMQFAVNVLGYFRMIRAFTPHLQAGALARVINVASYWAGDLDPTDLEFHRRPYRNGTAYRQSKQANRMLTVAFAERLRPLGISVNACHPGDVNSKLSNDLGFGGHETPEEGAATPLWLATSSIGLQQTGRYFAHMREEPCRFAKDRQAIESLYAACEKYDARIGPP